MMEVRNVKKSGRKKGDLKIGEQGKMYVDYLRESDYSQTLKDLYFKNQYRYVYIPERLWNSDAFIRNIKNNYQAYLNDN